MRKTILIITSLILSPGVVFADSNQKICEQFRDNYAKEREKVEERTAEPYKEQKLKRIDDKEARLERKCAQLKGYIREDEELPDDIELDTPKEKIPSTPAEWKKAWKAWADHYNTIAKKFIDDFGDGILDDGNQYSYWMNIRVLPNGKVQLAPGPPGSDAIKWNPKTTNTQLDQRLLKYRKLFKEGLQKLKPRKFPPGSLLPAVDYQIRFDRTETGSDFKRALPPVEPPHKKKTK